jgi:hypothetical protein
LKCAIIEHEIKRWLLGSEATKGIKLLRQTAVLAKAELTPRDDVRQSLQRIFDPDKGRQTAIRLDALPAKRPPDRSPDHPLPGARTVAQADDKSDCRRTTREGSDGSPSQSASSSAKGLMLSYAPMWDTKNEALLLFRPIIDAPSLFASPFDIDLAVLNRIHRDLAALAQKGRRIPVIAPVDADTIANNKNRTVYLSVLRAIPVAIRRLLVIEAPADQIAEQGLSSLAAELRTLGVALALSATLDFEAMHEAKRLGAKFAMCNVVLVDEMQESALGQLERFAARAAACGLECGIVGAHTKSIVVAAVTAGFRFVSGRALNATVSSLEDVLRHSPRDIFAPNR